MADTEIKEEIQKEAPQPTPSEIFANHVLTLKKNMESVDAAIIRATDNIKTLEEQKLIFKGAYNATIELGIKLGYFSVDDKTTKTDTKQ